MDTWLGLSALLYYASLTSLCEIPLHLLWVTAVVWHLDLNTIEVYDLLTWHEHTTIPMVWLSSTALLRFTGWVELGYHFQHQACKLAEVIAIPPVRMQKSMKTVRAKQLFVLFCFVVFYGPDLKAIHIISAHISVNEAPSHDYTLLSWRPVDTASHFLR